MANPIYAEVVPRHLNYAVQAGMPQRMAWYVDADGGLDVEGLIAAFQAFFREHSEHWVQPSSNTTRPARSCCCRRTCSASSTAAAHRAGVRAGARAHRPAYRVAAGRARTALGGGVQGAAWRAGADHRGGLGPDASLSGPAWAEAGHLIVFDRSPERGWEKKIFRRVAPPAAGAPITVWGM